MVETVQRHCNDMVGELKCSLRESIPLGGNQSTQMIVPNHNLITLLAIVITSTNTPMFYRSSQLNAVSTTSPSLMGRIIGSGLPKCRLSCKPPVCGGSSMAQPRAPLVPMLMPPYRPCGTCLMTWPRVTSP